MNRYFIECLILCCAVIAGCSSLGQNYTPIKSIPEGQALVYLYYPANEKIPGQAPGSGHIFTISKADKIIVKMERGGYFPLFAESGELSLSTKLAFKLLDAGALNVAASPKTDFTLQVDPGKTYYLEGVYFSDLGFFSMGGLRFHQVSDEFQAQLLLEECKLLPKYEPVE